ncbi:MAG: hypothetical protein QOG62_2628, partial [Thermoleophilaceae bacterium]|nr:hypothetical protein [Thermoleophilaceae bacterium]
MLLRAIPAAFAVLLLVPAGASAATFTVSNTDNAGPGSLRQAILDANGNANPAEVDFIDIQATGTLDLQTPGLQVSQPVSIQGPGARLFTIVGKPAMVPVLSVSTTGDSQLSGITITGGGAAISKGGGSLLLDRAAIVANGRTVGANDSGGGITVSGGAPLQVQNSLIANNFLNNTNPIGGGAAGGAIIYTGGGTQNSIVNSTITGNSVSAQSVTPGTSKGGAIAIANGNVLTVVNSTITGNSSRDPGSAIVSESGSKVQLLNTILSEPSGNTLCSALPVPGGGQITSGGGNIASDASCFLGATGDKASTDPQLGPLQDNGGQTDSRLPLATSPAIDNGLASGLLVDQRGFVRPVDQIAIANTGDGSDSGAVEVSLFCRGAVPSIAGTAGADVLNGTAGPDVIQALGGNDKVSAGDGNDLVCGGGGKDRLGGGKGNDTLAGEAGRDKLIGGNGKDRLLGGKSKDSCT